MTGTPRKSASAGYDNTGAVRGMSGQGENIPRQGANPSGGDKADYVRKETSLGPNNLPLKRVEDGTAPSGSGSTETSTGSDGGA